MRKSIISCLLVILFACTAITVSAKTIYVSSSGSDTSNGTSSSPFATLSASYKSLSGDTDIILLDSASFVNPPAHSGKLTLKGNTSSVTLTLPSETILAGQLKFDNLTLNTGTIYANGHTLEISSTVTSTGAIAVFGGKKGASFAGNTDIRLYGGQYSSVFGGCNGGTVNGNTNVIFGGNAKQSGALYIYGGSSNAAVNGTSTVTLEGNAQCTYIFGAGIGEYGSARVTDIYI